VMYKWCQPSRLQYGSRATKSRANGLVRELFFQFGIFARETLNPDGLLEAVIFVDIPSQPALLI